MGGNTGAVTTGAGAGIASITGAGLAGAGAGIGSSAGGSATDG
jgi:hypothetical protein